MGEQETMLVVTGANGRVGRLLRAVWHVRAAPGLRVMWVPRRGKSGPCWDILTGQAPGWPAGAVVLHLAGAVAGDTRALERNSAMIAPLLAACRSNRVIGILHASTAAVYAPSGRGAEEEERPDPQGAYGRAKLAAENALVSGLEAGDMALVRLRIGNIVGADALVGAARAGEKVLLDPVPGRPGGPVRSWLGPVTLARLIAQLARDMGSGEALPGILNLASDPPLSMASLLDAATIPWTYGPPRAGVIAAATLSLARLAALYDLPPVSAASLIAELAVVQEGMACAEGWP